MYPGLRYTHKKNNFCMEKKSFFLEKCSLSTKLDLRLKTILKKFGVISNCYLVIKKKLASHTISIYGNCMILFFFSKIKIRFFHHRTVLLETNSRRFYFISFFNRFSKMYENCMASIFPYT